MPAPEESSLAARPSAGRRLIGIEGLRGIAALLVVFRHVGQYTTDAERTGWLGRLSEWSTHGLTLFFVLSGFLLFRPFAAAIVSGEKSPSVRKYAVNRCLRIFPGYIVIFTVTCLIFGLAYTGGAVDTDNPDSIGRLSDPTAVALNLVLLQTYLPEYLLTGISPAWSLTVELTFYLSLPLLATAAARLLSSRVSALTAVTAPAALLIVVGLGTTAALTAAQLGLTEAEADRFAWGPTWTAVVSRSFLAQADLFGYGMLVAVLLVVLRRRGEDKVPRWCGAALLVAGVCFVLLSLPEPGSLIRTNLVGLAAAVVLAAVVLPAGPECRRGNRLAQGLEWGPMRYLGLISYSIYLWHTPVILGLRGHSLVSDEGAVGLILTTALTTVVVLALSTVTYFLVERPAMTRRAPWHRGNVDRTRSGVADATT